MRRRRMTIHRPSEVRDAPALPLRPDRSNAVDELFAEEYDAARSAGLACSLFCDEELESGRFRARPEFPANTQVLYRGWMLTPENYARLHGRDPRRWRTAPDQSTAISALPLLAGWYPLCEDLTPATLFLSRNADSEAVLAQSPWRAWFVKDHVKSLTTQRGSKATNAAEVREVLDSIERYRAPSKAVYAFGSSRRCVRKPRNATSFFTAALHGRLDAVPPLVEQVAQRIDCPFFFRRRGRVDQWRVAPDGTRRWPGLRPQAMAAARFAAMLAWHSRNRCNPNPTKLPDRS
ncbi:hypothetical protein P4234_27150 [Pseudomonas aeruginosa]|nr:hypothetical protein [Pseudomonas aeruginosa]